MGLHPPRRRPHYGGIAQCQRTHGTDRGGQHLQFGQLCRGVQDLLPERRRRGRSSYPAAGYGQRGSRCDHRRGSRQRVLRRGADRHPQPCRGQRCRRAAKDLGDVHRRHHPHRKYRQKPELPHRLAGGDQRDPRRGAGDRYRVQIGQRHHQ